MQIHCPNCKNTSESINKTPGYAAWLMSYASLVLAGIGAGIGLGSKEPFIAGLAIVLTAPLMFSSLGYILWSCKHVIDSSDSARCPICRYPWGVPVTHAPTVNKPPLQR